VHRRFLKIYGVLGQNVINKSMINNVFYLLANVGGPSISMSPIMLIVAIFLFGLVFASIAFCIWMLVDCLKNEPSEGNDKIVWLLVILLLQGLGALIYFFVRRPERIKRFGR